MHPPPKIALSDDFLKSFAAIPRDRQQAVLKFVAQFRQNPRATGINYETIREATDRNMRSVRIDQAVFANGPYNLLRLLSDRLRRSSLHQWLRNGA